MKILQFCTTCLVFMACVNRASDNHNMGPGESAAQQSVVHSPDSAEVQKMELTTIYTLAISEFIKAAYKNDQTTFDTLFFGKHVYGQPDDFPDIKLPETIENTHIRLVSPEVGQTKQKERKSLVFVNLIGWVEKENAEFYFVVFSNGLAHQYDYFVNFTRNTSSNQFVLESIEFEDYYDLKGQERKRIVIFENGKYVDKKE